VQAGEPGVGLGKKASAQTTVDESGNFVMAGARSSELPLVAKTSLCEIQFNRRT